MDANSLIELYNNDWVEICRYQRLSEKFLNKYLDKLNWFEVTEHQKLSNQFIKTHYKLLDSYKLYIYQKLDTELLEFLNEKLNFGYTAWYNVSRYQILEESFILKYKDNLDFDVISQNQNLTETFIFNNTELFSTWQRINCLLDRKIITKNSLQLPDPIYSFFYSSQALEIQAYHKI